MLAIFRFSIDNRPYSFARDARVQRKHGTYYETFEFHDYVILQVRDVLRRPLYVNIRITSVWSTVEAVEGTFFVEVMHSLLPHRCFSCVSHQVTNKALIEKLVRNLDRFHVRHVAIHLARQMHQS